MAKSKNKDVSLESVLWNCRVALRGIGSTEKNRDAVIALVFLKFLGVECMINYELKPTFDNLKKTLLEDSIGRNEGIANFIKFLNLTDNNIVIALNDDWGNGKTFFVKQTQMVLQSYDESKDELKDIRQCMSKFFQGNEEKPYFPVYYDAWTNDNDEDPVLSIVFTMLQSIGDLKKYEVTDRNG